jgi:acyl-coenzyme A synthetase/AMP-(fatty) acid ligase
MPRRGRAGLRIGPLEADEAVDLVHALAVRGIVGTPVRARRAHVVLVLASREDPEQLLEELCDTLAAWLADRGRGAVELRSGRRRLTVEALAAARTV